MRRGENTAMPERARAELARAFHQADDAPGRELVGDALEERRVGELLHVWLSSAAAAASSARQLTPPDG